MQRTVAKAAVGEAAAVVEAARSSRSPPVYADYRRHGRVSAGSALVRWEEEAVASIGGRPAAGVQIPRACCRRSSRRRLRKTQRRCSPRRRTARSTRGAGAGLQEQAHSAAPMWASESCQTETAMQIPDAEPTLHRQPVRATLVPATTIRAATIPAPGTKVLCCAERLWSRAVGARRAPRRPGLRRVQRAAAATTAARARRVRLR